MIDCNGKTFGYILDYLRDRRRARESGEGVGEIIVPSAPEEVQRLARDAAYCGLPDLVMACEPEPDPEPEPEPEPEPCTDQKMLDALAKWKAKTPNWASATTLGLNGNQIKDVTPLASLTSLTSLGLYGNQIQDRSPLQHLEKSCKICW